MTAGCETAALLQRALQARSEMRTAKQALISLIEHPNQAITLYVWESDLRAAVRRLVDAHRVFGHAEDALLESQGGAS